MNARTLAALALGTALAAAAPAQATYFKRFMHDYDQFRTALPNGGAMYCVPTSYVNLFKFMAWNGLPAMDDNYGDTYASVTSFIAAMGMVMGTDPVDGTGWAGGYSTAKYWVNQRTNNPVVHYRYGTSTVWGPDTIRDLVATGALVRIAYGRYELKFGNKYVRDSGHAVALSGYDWRYAQKSLFVADPAADEGNPDAQSAFNMQPKTTAQTALIDGSGKVMWLPRYDVAWKGLDDKWMAVIDDMHGIAPTWVGTFKGVVKENAMASGAQALAAPPENAVSVFEATIPGQIEDGVNVPVRDWSVGIEGKVRDWCMDHGGMAAFALGESGAVSRLSIVSKAVERFASVPGATRIVVAGADRSVYALVPGPTADRLVRIDRRTAEQTSLVVPKGVTAIEPDPMTRGLAMLNPAGRSLIRVDEDLRTTSARPVEMPEGMGELFLAPEENGTVTLARSGARTLVRIGSTGGVQRMALAAPMDLRAFQRTDNGLYLAQDGERLVTLDAWGRPAVSPFDGMVRAGRARFAQSWQACRPSDYEGPGWREVAPQRGQP